PFTHHQNRAGRTSRRSRPRPVSGAPASLCTVHGAVSEAAPEAIRPHALSSPHLSPLLNKTRPQTFVFLPDKVVGQCIYKGTARTTLGHERPSKSVRAIPTPRSPGHRDSRIVWN